MHTGEKKAKTFYSLKTGGTVAEWVECTQTVDRLLCRTAKEKHILIIAILLIAYTEPITLTTALQGRRAIVPIEQGRKTRHKDLTWFTQSCVHTWNCSSLGFSEPVCCSMLWCWPLG